MAPMNNHQWMVRAQVHAAGGHPTWALEVTSLFCDLRARARRRGERLALVERRVTVDGGPSVRWARRPGGSLESPTGASWRKLEP